MTVSPSFTGSALHHPLPRARVTQVPVEIMLFLHSHLTRSMRLLRTNIVRQCLLSGNGRGISGDAMRVTRLLQGLKPKMIGGGYVGAKAPTP